MSDMLECGDCYGVVLEDGDERTCQDCGAVQYADSDSLGSYWI